jgi:hypothetical protein
MLACVVFRYVERAETVKDCVEEEGNIPLRSSSISLECRVAESCVGVVVTTAPDDDIIQSVGLRASLGSCS